MNKLQTILKKIKSMFSSNEEPVRPKAHKEVGTRIDGQLFVTLDDSKRILSKSNPQPTPEMQQAVVDAMRESMIVDGYDTLSKELLEDGITVKEKNELIGTRQEAAKLPAVDEQEFIEKSAEKHESILRKSGPRYSAKMPPTTEEQERIEKVDAVKQEMKKQIETAKTTRAKSLKNKAKTTKSKSGASKRRKSK